MSDAPELQQTQDVRFAVVMYGGVSLAIYMNGVAQEMLRLVRSTAPSEPGKTSAKTDITGSEKVYRKLGQMLQRGQRPKELAEVEAKDNSPILTRFMVDIISGTSAGGINGVFLAKALANEQNIDQLKKLWVEVGDFDKLLNDKKFFSSLAPPTQSLLDGRYLYRELLNALDGMENPDSTDTDAQPYVKSPLVEELDLFITTTDISGLTLPLRLADKVVNERRHRNVFHFVYTTPYASGESRNDFSRPHNPFLAFAARCTSSFPIAFEPMKLGDIDDAVKASDFYKTMRKKVVMKDGTFTSSDVDWRKFYTDYIAERAHKTAAQNASDFLKRAFGDGGYLDNKPFSYATDTLLRRRADVPVDRKLIFVDPDPENTEKLPDFDADVDVLKNTMSALTPTVSTETIREDIQRILDRNRLIERLSRVTEDVDTDVRAWRNSSNKELSAPLSGDEWAKMGLDGMIERKGIAYGGYYRLKVSALTDELASIIVDAANLEAESDEFLAIRYVVRAWRDERYTTGRVTDPKFPSQNRFIMDFDLSYRLRRLNFLRTKIDEYSCLGAEKLAEKLKSRFEWAQLPAEAEQLESFRAAFQKILSKLQQRLSGEYKDLLQIQRKYHRRVGDREPHPLRELVSQTQITPASLKNILNEPDDEKRMEHVRRLLKETPTMAAFDEIGRRITEDFSKTTRAVSDKCREILNPEQTAESADPQMERAVREVLWHYYQGYEDYDMVAFPIMYQTGVGETDIVDVIRISPYDATSLINLAEEEKSESGRRKLGGVALGHFGAFLDQTWRENDIMWGRLDAAEILIKTLLPVPKESDTESEEETKQREKREAEQKSLIEEAQKAILKEELLPKGEEQLRGDYIAALVDMSAGLPVKETIKKVRERIAQSSNGSPELKKILDSCVNENDLLKYFNTEYEVNRALEAQSMVRLFARSTKVIGRMLEVLAEKHRVDAKRITWVTRLGQVFWGLVEVAVPGSFWNLFLKHWIKLLYAFEAFLIIGSILLPDPAMQRFGLLALAITGATHATVKVLGDYMRRGHLKFLRALGGVGFIIIVALFIASAALGFDELLAVLKLRDRAASLPWVQSLASTSPVGWFFGLEPESRALALTAVIASAVTLIAIFLNGGKQALTSLLQAVKARFARKPKEPPSLPQQSDVS